MSLSEEYNRKRKNSAGEVLEELRDGDYVLSAQAMAEPVTLLEAMPLLKKRGRKGITTTPVCPWRICPGTMIPP